MIISKFGKPYDTADGSEQHHAAAPEAAAGVRAPRGVQDEQTSRAEASCEKRKNDSGTLLVQPPISPLELSAKPAWSVLSLRDLNAAIRLADWPDNPDHLRRAQENAERNKLDADELEAKRIASSARAHRDRYRNAWENT
jgi:hypothetical protein